MILDSYSVLMSVYKKENPEFLKCSINSMLNQTVKPSEFIIIKDGPLTKELNDVIESYSKNNEIFNVIQLEKNLGLGLALRNGILAAKNELIIRMDSDDIVDETKSEKQLKIYKENNNLGLIGTNAISFIDSIENKVYEHRFPEKNKEIYEYMKKRNAFLHGGIMFKKSDVIKVGNYEDTKLYEDYDLFSRLIYDLNVKGYNIQEDLYYVRTTSGFFARRGGIEYVKNSLSFLNKQYKRGYISFASLITSAVIRTIVYLSPNKLREWFYLKFLRKKIGK